MFSRWSSPLALVIVMLSMHRSCIPLMIFPYNCGTFEFFSFGARRYHLLSVLTTISCVVHSRHGCSAWRSLWSATQPSYYDFEESVERTCVCLPTHNIRPLLLQHFCKWCKPEKFPGVVSKITNYHQPQRNVIGLILQMDRFHIPLWYFSLSAETLQNQDLNPTLYGPVPRFLSVVKFRTSNKLVSSSGCSIEILVPLAFPSNCISFNSYNIFGSLSFLTPVIFIIWKYLFEYFITSSFYCK